MGRRLRILIWHIHGSYLNALARLDHDWYLPVKPGRPPRYTGRGPTFDLPPTVREVPAEQVRHLSFDLVIHQTPENFFEDQYAILSREQRALPCIYLEHNTPRPHPCDTRHPVDEPTVLLVHVTHYNRLMWDCGRTPTQVIEHSVAIDPRVRYRGELERGMTLVNGLARRGRLAGCDLFLWMRERLPLDLAGMESEQLGGLGDIPYRQLHRRLAAYRFLFSPMRYSSLPLAVIEAMTIGMPVVALATTALPTVITHGVHGYLSCDPDELLAGMRRLLQDAAHARRLGEQARRLALTRFGLERFRRDWERAFARALALRQAVVGGRESESESEALQPGEGISLAADGAARPIAMPKE